jgi:glycosyltransferase involved in cell wall biosynthesis
MRSHKKVILVTRSALIGGVEEHVSQLAHYLAKEGYHVLWLVLSGEGAARTYRRIPGVHSILLNDTEGQSFSSFLLLGKLLRIVWRFHPRIVHLHGIRPMFLLSLIPFPFQVKRICTLHASYLLMAMDSEGRIISWKRLLSALFHIFSCVRSNFIIAVSQTLAHEIQRLVAPFKFNKIQVVHNGVDCSVIPANTTLPATIAGTFQADEMQVVFIGRLETKKGVELIIRAVSMLSPSVKIRCHLLGDGYQRKRFEALAKTENVCDRLHFWGSIINAGQLLNSFDVLVLPSFSEGMGIAVLEAMAAGLPVVATNTGVGDYASLAQRLEFLFLNPEKRKAMGQAGQKRAFALFNKQTQFESIRSIYGMV